MKKKDKNKYGNKNKSDRNLYVLLTVLVLNVSCSSIKVNEQYEGDSTVLYLLENHKFILVHNLTFYSPRVGLGEYLIEGDEIILRSSIEPKNMQILNKLEYRDSTSSIILYDVEGWPIKKEGLDYFVDSNYITVSNWNASLTSGKEVTIIDNKYGFVYKFPVEEESIDLIEVRCEVNYGNYQARDLNYMIFDSLMLNLSDMTIRTNDLGIFYLNKVKLQSVDDLIIRKLKRPFIIGMTKEDQEYLLEN